MSAKNREGETPLHLACHRNNLKMVKFLIEEQKADPAVTCRGGKSALHYAAEYCNSSILRYLIEDQKQDIKAADNEGRTALHLVSTSCSLGFKKRLVSQEYLLEEHPKIIEAEDKTGKTALFTCLENKTYAFYNFRPLALILATKAKILTTQEHKDTDHVFDWIKQSYDNDMQKSRGEDEAVSCLIAGLQSFQKELNEKNPWQFTCNNPLLPLVSYCNRVDIAEFMFKQDLCYIETHFNVKEANSKRKMLLESYLRFSCENGLLDLTRFLFQEIKNRQESFEHWTFYGCLRTACTNKHFDVWKYLLEDDQAKDGAAEFLKNFPLPYACRNGSLEMVQYLIETKKIDIEVKARYGSTPLHSACYAGAIEIVQYLIEKQKASIDTANNKGRSVWHFAVEFDCLEIVKYISQNANKNVKAQDVNAQDVNAQDVNAQDVNAQDVNAQDVNAQDEDGSTALHLVCQQHNPSLKVVKFLVSKGANVLAKDKSGEIPLQTAKHKETTNKLIPFLEVATKR